MSLRFVAISALSALLFACAPDRAPPVFDGTPRCGAESLQGLIGQDAGVLGELDFAAPLRVFHPGMLVTADYNPGRLNISVGGDGIITRVWCS